MHAENLVVDYGRDWEDIEHTTAPGPHHGVAVFLLELVVEAVLMGNWKGNPIRWTRRIDIYGPTSPSFVISTQ